MPNSTVSMKTSLKPFENNNFAPSTASTATGRPLGRENYLTLIAALPPPQTSNKAARLYPMDAR